MRTEEEAFEEKDQGSAIRERMEKAQMVRDRVDAQGVKWRELYFGGGEPFKNWVAQCKELGEVVMEEVDSKGFRCFDESGERLCRIWLKVEETERTDVF
jgi:organic radical activating enzyme